MKLFFKKIFLFFLPILLLLLFVEYYILYFPNNFNTRANFFKSNKKNIEVLFFGSSHTQFGVNQEFLDMKAANIAYSGQDYQIDNALFFKYIKELKKVKYIFIEYDYFSLEERVANDFFKIPWYYRYYDVEIYPVSFINKVSLYSSSPTFFNNYIEDRFNPSKNKSSINKYGFTLNDKTGIFYKEKFDSLKICDLADKRLNRRHWKISIQNYNANTIKIKEVINFCKSNKIKVVLLRMPVYATYKKRYNIEKLNRNLLFLKKLIKKDEVELLSFENDTDFHLKDFKDDDHLNEFGAKKLCKKINLYLTTKK